MSVRTKLGIPAVIQMAVAVVLLLASIAGAIPAFLANITLLGMFCILLSVIFGYLIGNAVNTLERDAKRRDNEELAQAIANARRD